MNMTNPKKNKDARRKRRRLPEITMTRVSLSVGRLPAAMSQRHTYSRPSALRNGNGSKYDPVAEDTKKGRRQ